MTVILGGGGQVATAFRHLLPDAKAPTRAELDIADLAALPHKLADLRPSRVINCAAFTAVDRAENEPELANLINGTAVGALAQWCNEHGVPFVSFSSDYVFDGTGTRPYLESSIPNPINVYGRSKLAGERAALAAYPASLVIRTSWVFSTTHRNFVTNIVERAANAPVSVVNDQTGSPTYAIDLAEATLRAMDREVTGLLHIANTGATTWFGLAAEACASAGLDPSRVTAVTSGAYPTRATRPRYSVLGSERSKSFDLPPMRSWQEAVRAALTTEHD